MDSENPVAAPVGPDVSLDLDVDGYRLVRRLVTAKRALALWTEEERKVRQELLNLAGDARSLRYGPTVVATISASQPRRFDSKAFAEDHPDLYETYLVQAGAFYRITPGRALPPDPAERKRSR